MHRLKTFMLVTALILTGSGLKAQQKNYINVSAQAGFVVNSQLDRKFGIGGSAAFIIPDQLITSSENNYWTFTAKLFNNPVFDGKFISSIANKEYDALNYFGILGGYRFTRQGISNGFFAEPRIGFGLLDQTVAFIFSPVAGYAYNNFDFAVFADAGASVKTTIIGKKQFFTLGLSIGYNIEL